LTIVTPNISKVALVCKAFTPTPTGQPAETTRARRFDQSNRMEVYDCRNGAAMKDLSASETAEDSGQTGRIAEVNP
jgi:hypothetical protein